MACLALGKEDDGPSRSERARTTVKEGRTAGKCERSSDQIRLGDGRASSVVRARESRRHAHVGGLVRGVRASGARWADRVDVGEIPYVLYVCAVRCGEGGLSLGLGAGGSGSLM